MQQESKPLFIQAYKTQSMKYIRTILSLTFLFLGVGINQMNAQNLQFNSAVFNEYGPVSTTSSQTLSVVFTGELVVGPNQVLKITSMNSSTNLGGAANSNLKINGHSIVQLNETYLPTGTYVVTFTNYVNFAGNISAYINGVLYDIVP